MTQPTSDVESAPPPLAAENVCVHCGTAEPVAGHAMALCGRCRQHLSQRPFPLWIRLAGVATVVLMCVALMSFPRSFAAGMAMERGQRHEAHGRFAQAGDEYRKVLRTYPTSTDVLVRLVITEYRAGRYPGALAALDALEGHELEQATYDSLSLIDRQVRDAAPPKALSSKTLFAQP